MTKLKICGIRRMADVELVNKYKPDFAGFIFAKSPRMITMTQAKEMISNLDDSIIPVGVFVNETIKRTAEIAEYCGLAIIQLHGDEDIEYLKEVRKAAGCIVWKAFRIKDKDSVEKMPLYNSDGYLADTYTSTEYGGSGKTFRWDLLDGVSKEKLILAGGLNPNNILDAISAVRPFAVDVNSGVETNGFKDENKIKLLTERLKGANLSWGI